MKRMFFKSFLSVLFAAVLLGSCKPNDTTILKQAQEKVGTVDPAVTVEVNEGVVTLSGQVTDEATRMNVENVVKEVRGVRSVVNNVVATPPPPAPAPITANDDATITQAINAGLEAKGITGVNVVVMNGEVTLTGDVKRLDVEAILQVANESKPTRVVNNLVVK